jgi:hypothetical protein
MGYVVVGVDYSFSMISFSINSWVGFSKELIRQTAIDSTPF